MQRVVLSSRIALNASRSANLISARSVGVSVANFSIEGTLGKKGHALEEAYFKKVERSETEAFAEKLHAKELKTLLAALGEHKSKIDEETLHKLLEWKHGH